MKERGMIFNSEMVRAILEGKKTQTRRIITNVGHDNCLPLQKRTKTKDGIYTHVMDAPIYDLCPFGKMGDRIWVRETFCAVPDHEEPAGCSALLYAADGNGPYGKWTPSIHMPRWASRITLEITGVRVERLNSISQEDAQAEGMELTGWRPTYSDPDSGGEIWTPYDNFAQLWESIYGEESWKANPWVWVIEFKRLEA